MSIVPVAALSKSSKQKVLFTTSTPCLFMCSWRVMKVVLQFQNQDALRSAPWGPATSPNVAGSKPPKSPHNVFRQQTAHLFGSRACLGPHIRNVLLCLSVFRHVVDSGFSRSCIVGWFRSHLHKVALEAVLAEAAVSLRICRG